jgi:hypothetical protein
MSVFDYLLETTSDNTVESMCGDSKNGSLVSQQDPAFELERSAPASAFETSATFLTEIYTIQDSEPTLFYYDAREVQVPEYCRVISCYMFYSKSPRQWTGLTFSITTTIEYQYWKLWRLSSANPDRFQGGNIPTRLKTEFETFLETRLELDHDTHVWICI